MSEIPETCSIPWFINFMRLHNSGVTPTVMPTEYMPLRLALAEFFDRKTATGFAFDDQGIPSYKVYVHDLFSRVLQLPWPLSGVLTFHFS